MNAADVFAHFHKPLSRPLSMVTCYDASFASILDEAGIDVLLVGDSLANVMLGYSRTADIGMPEMLHHTKAVRRGALESCIVVDLPFGADATPELAATNSVLLVQAGADAVKLEGCLPEQVRAIREKGIEVVGHLGLLPQTATSLKQAGRTPEEAARILADAKTLEAAGCCAIVLEHIPSDLGEVVTDALAIPTVGIGGGNKCAGQVLVLHDLLGLTAKQPPFAKRYVDLRGQALSALRSYHADVSSRHFPAG
ncbi:MAG: 3-methyl-2-oxobutanoate hydroxymethyltransferase [Fibrobacterota bacterium]